jgi:hypothetical protein
VETIDHVAHRGWLAWAVVQRSLAHEFPASNARASLGAQHASEELDDRDCRESLGGLGIGSELYVQLADLLSAEVADERAWRIADAFDDVLLVLMRPEPIHSLSHGRSILVGEARDDEAAHVHGPGRGPVTKGPDLDQ